jgi:hypothetical protein
MLPDCDNIAALLDGGVNRREPATGTCQESAMQDASDQPNDLIYAQAPDGRRLPVIDLTNRRFAAADDPASLAGLRENLDVWERKQRWMPTFLTRMLMRQAAKRSALMAAMFSSRTGFLDSITTYVLKLGVENFPEGFPAPMDLLRLRMQQIAKFLAKALIEPLSASAGAPLHLLNIAGGPALDSINTILFLSPDRPELLQRPIVIDVLDMQADGPAFGANALDALKQAGAPLNALSIEFRHQPYDWNTPATLTPLLAALRSTGAVVAASSEGGLFEYGSDEAIIGNLKTLREGGVDFVSGSVTSASDSRKRMIANTKFNLVPRGLAGFVPLATRGGYEIARSETAYLSDQVLLRISR